MGQTTEIQWCDSTCNAQMGCDGCELWAPGMGVRVCYAGLLTERMAGQKGWPADFSKPELFPGRIEEAARWTDLRGQERPSKPWLSGLSRLIFLDDMGDTFTESLPLDWLLPDIPTMEQSPHLWLFLTKRARRMRAFFEQLGYIPDNFWLGVSVTNDRTLRRAYELAKIEGALLWLSLEPLWDSVDLSGLLELDNRPAWIVIGGESGAEARLLELKWARSILEQAQAAGLPVFVKQLGSAWASQVGGDSKGGDWSLWPEELRVREYPVQPEEQEQQPEQLSLFQGVLDPG